MAHRLVLGAGALFIIAAAVTVPLLLARETSAFPIVPTEDLVARGRVIYRANCQSCHGDEKAEGLKQPAPPHTASGHTWHHPDRQLYEWVLDGPPLRTIMPSFRGALSQDEIIAVLAYIKSFWPEDIRRLHTEISGQYEDQLRRLPPASGR